MENVQKFLLGEQSFGCETHQSRRFPQHTYMMFDVFDDVARRMFVVVDDLVS